VSVTVQSTFRTTLEEGEQRIQRTWASLLATGAVGGIDVSMGVLAVLLVFQVSHNELAAAIAFGIGFVTVLRLVQVGAENIKQEQVRTMSQAAPDAGEREPL
jgi:hypothetical protein